MIRSTAWQTFLSILFYKGVVIIWHEQISLAKTRTRAMKINWTFYTRVGTLILATIYLQLIQN